MMSRNETYWWMTVSAYLAGAAVPLMVLLALASGYGTKFLGVWTPPHSNAFRHNVFVAMILAIVVCGILSVAVFIRGPKGPRIAAIVPAIFSTGCGILIAVLAIQAAMTGAG